MAKKKEMFCYVCKDLVHHKEHYVQLSTYNRKTESKALPDDHNYFHMRCFSEYINKKINDRARQQVKDMQSKAMQIFQSPEIMSVLKNVKGIETLQNMVNLNLDKNKDIIVDKERVKKKIYDVRRKARRKRKRKTTL
jgi:hypothetical protein